MIPLDVRLALKAEKAPAGGARTVSVLRRLVRVIEGWNGYVMYNQQECIMNKKAVLSLLLACIMLCANQFVVAQAAGPGPGHKPPDDKREEKKAPSKHAPQEKQGPPPKAHPGPPPQGHLRPGDRAHHDYRRPPVPHGYHHNRYKFSDSWHARHGHIRPGYVMPRHYYDHRATYVIHDWRGHGLYAPPPGHYWLGVDGNFVLAAIATGVVAHILLAH